jgi:abscisate beta-glucosyltransferase
LELAYTDYTRNELGKKAWIVGPVSLCNRSLEDKKERGKQPTIDEQSCLNWLNSMKPNSVLYVSFGRVACLSMKQIQEIAYGLEPHSFGWLETISTHLKMKKLVVKVGFKVFRW